MNTEQFFELPNIGKEISGKLMKCHITSAYQLKQIGSRNAFLKILLIDCTACLDMLYALEGAVQGIRWHNLTPDKKNELKRFYQSIKGLT
jgi:DNA transformation protein and related proteins